MNNIHHHKLVLPERVQQKASMAPKLKSPILANSIEYLANILPSKFNYINTPPQSPTSAVTSRASIGSTASSVPTVSPRSSTSVPMQKQPSIGAPPPSPTSPLSPHSAPSISAASTSAASISGASIAASTSSRDELFEPRNPADYGSYPPTCDPVGSLPSPSLRLRFSGTDLALTAQRAHMSAQHRALAAGRYDASLSSLAEEVNGKLVSCCLSLDGLQGTTARLFEVLKREMEGVLPKHGKPRDFDWYLRDVVWCVVVGCVEREKEREKGKGEVEEWRRKSSTWFEQVDGAGEGLFSAMKWKDE